MEPDGIPSTYRPENAWSYDEEAVFACDADSDVLDEYFGAAGGVMILEPGEDEKFDEKRIANYDEDEDLMSRALEELGTNFIAASEVGEIVQRDESQRDFGQMIDNIMAATSLEELHDILVAIPEYYPGAGLLAEACSERMRKRKVRLVG
ncbi:hypothetical protein IJM16_04340 [Candidatus Saccharibacteria bacterium]|nr:hypothetical protein [Candidatus Saccharibacteria bacterium]